MRGLSTHLESTVWPAIREDILASVNVEHASEQFAAAGALEVVVETV
jgi:hypothetical protein